MKKFSLSFLVPAILSLLILVSCSREPENNFIPLDSAWKFSTGDDPAWATTAYNDSAWASILPSNNWEYQGFKGHDGFAWYRLNVMIPSSLKEKAYIKDSLQFLLGKIDD